jgi:hypothetical protein
VRADSRVIDLIIGALLALLVVVLSPGVAVAAMIAVAILLVLGIASLRTRVGGRRGRGRR